MVTGSGPGDNSIFLWDFSDAFLEKEMHGHDGSVWALKVDWESAHKAVEEAMGVGVFNEDFGEEKPLAPGPKGKAKKRKRKRPEGCYTILLRPGL